MSSCLSDLFAACVRTREETRGIQAEYQETFELINGSALRIMKSYDLLERTSGRQPLPLKNSNWRLPVA
jgi:hypothetical protein